MNKLRTSIRNTELNWIANTIVRAYNTNEKLQQDTFLSSLMKEIESVCNNLTTAIMQEKKLSMLAELDVKRNESLKVLGKLLEGYSVFPIKEKQEAAIPLKAIYTRYSKAKITKESYMRKSSLIESLLEDYSEPNTANLCAQLEGISIQLDKVREAQDSFIKSQDASADSKGTAATVYKKELLSLINTKMVPYLTAMLVAQPELFDEFSKVTETEINKINDTLTRRLKKLPQEEEPNDSSVDSNKTEEPAMQASQADPE